MADFVAIDFETANEDKASACAIGIVKVKNSRIVDTFYSLIRPPELFFHPVNVGIHGIDKKDVIDKPTWNSLWPKILPFFNKQIVVAHNAPFDMTVLEASLNTYQIQYPSFDPFCSLVIAREVWPDLESYSLSALAEFLDIDLDHHNACSDAEACAHIIIKACEEYEAESISELINHLNIGCFHLPTLQFCPSQTESIMVFAKSSGSKPHEVWFRKKNGKLIIECTCQAGRWHQMCKHKLGLIRGDISFLDNPAQEKDLKKALRWIKHTSLPKLLRKLDDIEFKQCALKDEFKECKAKINKAMKGIALDN